MNDEVTNEHGLPEMFRPLMWSYKFEAIDPVEDVQDIIVNTINYGRLPHWRWVISFYGKDAIREVLEKRLETEFLPEFRNLAKLVFGVKRFRHAR